MTLDELEIVATIWRTYSTVVPTVSRRAQGVDEATGETMYNRIDHAIGPLDAVGGFLTVGTPPSRTTDVSLSDDELRVVLDALRALRRAFGDEEFEILTGFTVQEAVSCVDRLRGNRHGERSARIPPFT